MTAATRYGDDANLPPPTRVAETLEAGTSPPPAYATVADVLDALDGLGRTPKAWQPWPEIVAAADAMLRHEPKPPA